MTITISHDAADGTLVVGDPRPHHGVLKAAGFRYSRRIPGWYLPHSRDRHARRDVIDRVAAGLRDVGFDVDVQIDDTQRTTAEREGDRVERLADRQAGLEAKAGKLHAVSEGHLAKAGQIIDMIPMGQPVLMGHHSQRRHQKDLARIETGLRKGFETLDEAKETARRAEASRANQAHRESAPVISRRIERLQAEARGITRQLTPCLTSGRAMKPAFDGQEFTCPACFHRQTITDCKVPRHGCADGEHAERITERRARLDEEISYWTGELEVLAAAGAGLLGPGDFVVGDRVLANGHPATVERVNKKSLTVRTDVMPQWTNTCSYSKVRKPQEAPAE